MLAAEGMSMIERAIKPLVPMNDGYSLTHNEVTGIVLDCGKKVGKYTFKIDHREEKLVMQSPISGTLEYFYDPTPGQGIWL